MNTLKTILLEPGILRDALCTGAVCLPDNYWRTALVKFCLRKNTIAELPPALRLNFCPLFWASNLLVATALLWYPVYLVLRIFMWFIGAIWVPILDAFFDWLGAKVKMSKRVRASRAIENYLAFRHDPTNFSLARLRTGRERLSWNIETVYTPDIPLTLTADQERKLITDHTLAAYYAFTKYYGPQHCNKLDELIRIAREKEEADAARKAASAAAWEAWIARMRRAFNIVKIAKPICKFLLYTASIVAAYYLGLYCIASWPHVSGVLAQCWLWLASLDWWVIGKYVLRGVLALSAVIATFWIGLNIGVPDFTKPFFSWLGNLIYKILDKTIGKVIRGLIGFLDFVVNFISMLYSENCPGVTYESELVSEESNTPPGGPAS